LWSKSIVKCIAAAMDKNNPVGGLTFNFKPDKKPTRRGTAPVLIGNGLGRSEATAYDELMWRFGKDWIATLA
jgi:hypothetical protein